MSKLPHDINDNEIRIISSDYQKNISGSHCSGKRKRRCVALIICAIIAAIFLITAMLIIFTGHKSGETVPEDTVTLTSNNLPETETDDTSLHAHSSGYVNISDTIINGASLTILNPVNANPALHIGTDILNDTTVVLAVHAADIREDNGGIVGAFVRNGELVSKGQAKAGYCAIISGNITLGVADATPLLEQALDNNGDFFRQYPLVVGNQIVENKPKGTALRRALAELNGHNVVILSNGKMTFHDFSEALVALGVSNAIYLVGGNAYGFAVDRNGAKHELGMYRNEMPANTNYIVWH